MKKTLLNLALVATLGLTFAQNPGLNEVAAYDDFASKNQYSIITNEMQWDSINHESIPNKKAYKGIYWWTKRTDGKGLDFVKSRTGNGVQSYTVNQAETAYEPLGVGFGTYATAAKDSSFFTLNITSSKVVTLTIKNTGTTDLEFKPGLSDINDVLLNGHDFGGHPYTHINVTATSLLSAEPNTGETNSGIYQYEYTIPVAAGETKNVSLDFTNSASITYEENTTGTGTDKGCKNRAYYKTSANTGFKFDKVKSFTLTPLNAAGTDLPEFPKCYGKLALANGTFEISNLKIGDVSSIVGISDEIIANFNNEVVTVYNITGSVVAKGNLADLNLTTGFFILKSASKTQKVVIQ